MNIQTFKNSKHWRNGDQLVAESIVSKEAAHEISLLHLSVHLLIISPKKEFLCRKRSDNDSRYAGLWTTTIGTHVPLNQSYEEVIQEMLPVKTDLQWVGEFRVYDRYENEVNGLFIAQEDAQAMGKNFLIDRKFISLAEVYNLISKSKTTPHLAEAIRLYNG